ncbi:MAG: hypothetical protein R3F31_17285 [Verrucomicrobiales bacterium]
MAGLKYKVDQHAVLIIPASGTDAEMITNVYIAPPSFISLAVPVVVRLLLPMTPSVAEAVEAVALRRLPAPNAREVLEGAGINFPPDPVRSTLPERPNWWFAILLTSWNWSRLS